MAEPAATIDAIHDAAGALLSATIRLTDAHLHATSPALMERLGAINHSAETLRRELLTITADTAWPATP